MTILKKTLRHVRNQAIILTQWLKSGGFWAGRRWPDLVASVDIGPTVLDVLGIYPDAGADLQTCPVAAADPVCGQPA